MHLLPGAVMEALRLGVSVKRINKFLNTPDLESSPICSIDQEKGDSESENAVEVGLHVLLSVKHV